jgi:hypothetical protein
MRVVTAGGDHEPSSTDCRCWILKKKWAPPASAIKGTVFYLYAYLWCFKLPGHDHQYSARHFYADFVPPTDGKTRVV